MTKPRPTSLMRGFEPGYCTSVTGIEITNEIILYQFLSWVYKPCFAPSLLCNTWIKGFLI
jgi:hypothetical protein